MGFGSVAPEWQLHLSAGARKLVVVFIVLGAIWYVSYYSLINTGALKFNASLTHGLGAEVAASSAYSTLGQQAQAFDHNTVGCQKDSDPVSCVEQQDAQFGNDLQTYGNTIAGIDYPSGVTSQVDAAQRAATDASHLLIYLSQSGTDPNTYQERVQSSDIQAKLSAVDSTYRDLQSALAGQ